MFCYLCKTLLQIRNARTHVYFLQNPSPKSILHTSNSTGQPSFTVSYLINSCGLSQEAALSAAKKIHLETSERPDSVLTFFKNHGFTKTHISSIISKRPILLLANPEKTLKPKVDFFNSSCIGPSLPKILSSNPRILLRSLENQIIPAFDLLRTLLRTDENIVTALRRSTNVLQFNLQKTMVPNISILQNHGVPEPMISKWIMSHSSTLELRSDRFGEIVLKIKDLGFDPKHTLFILAVRVMSMSKSKWKARKEVYRSLGWSEDEILSAFKKQPLCMATSEKKIRRWMDFFVNKLHMNPAVVSQYPDLVLLSLEKRIIPRCLVVQILLSKGLIKKNFSLYTILKPPEKKFLEKFLIKYVEEVPELLHAYQGKLKFEVLDIESPVFCEEKLYTVHIPEL
ncbi:uncharacterized protein LOC143887404 [Tasmannia lanceolata]|uniref:uncharacterized protein LOC143887404 n=1 Tax=Tasmannia lanceolata TaxID=3420 RepID=UPI004063D323